jgi:hypothetical protein
MALPLGYVPVDPNPCNPRSSKFNFPSYDGETTKLWITQAQDYFEMYGVPTYLWVKVAGMHFNGAAKRWIQSLDHPSQTPWPEFCKLLMDRFARDQHETLLRQMFHIQQTATVTDYVDKFSTIVNQLKAYTDHPDMHTFTTHFVDGLRPDICIVIAMQRPPNLDTAYSLALLQEEVVEPIKSYEYPRHGATLGYKTNVRNPLLQHHQAQPAKAAEQAPGATVAATPADKLSELRQYRRAQGLCDRCVEKWFRGHKCPPTVQLHAIQELWDLLALDELPESSAENQTKQVLLALSHDAQRGSQGIKTIQFNGAVHGRPVVVLVDSAVHHHSWQLQSQISYLTFRRHQLQPQLKLLMVSCCIALMPFWVASLLLPVTSSAMT